MFANLVIGWHFLRKCGRQILLCELELDRAAWLHLRILKLSVLEVTVVTFLHVQFEVWPLPLFEANRSCSVCLQFVALGRVKPLPSTVFEASLYILAHHSLIDSMCFCLSMPAYSDALLRWLLVCLVVVLLLHTRRDARSRGPRSYRLLTRGHGVCIHRELILVGEEAPLAVYICDKVLGRLFDLELIIGHDDRVLNHSLEAVVILLHIFDGESLAQL